MNTLVEPEASESVAKLEEATLSADLESLVSSRAIRLKQVQEDDWHRQWTIKNQAEHVIELALGKSAGH